MIMEISDSSILSFLLLTDVIAVLSTNQQRIRSHFFETHVKGAVPSLDSLTLSSKAIINEQQPSPLWLFICQRLRTAICDASPQSAGQCLVLKHLLLHSPHLRKLEIVRPIPASLKRLGSLTNGTCSSLCELTLGRPGFNNLHVTDSAMEHVLKTFGHQLIRLQFIKFNQLTTDTLHHIANHCQLSYLSMLSCEGISDTLLLAPQGMERLLASQGPSLVDLDVRFSVEMNDHWLQHMIISSCHSLRTFVASRTNPITIVPTLSSAVWNIFCAHFLTTSLLYIDCVGEEGHHNQSTPTFFLHELGELASLRSHVVVRPLDQRSLFGNPPRAPVKGLGIEARNGSPMTSCLSFLPNMINGLGSPRLVVTSECTGKSSVSTTGTARKDQGQGNDWMMCQSIEMNEADDDEA